MKFIFMLLALFLLTAPVLAGPTDNTSECLKMYGNYMNEYGDSRSIPKKQMFTFFDRCLPANTMRRPTNNDKPAHQKLLRIIDIDRKIVTIKT